MDDYSDWVIVEDSQPDYSDWVPDETVEKQKPSFVGRTDRQGFSGVTGDVGEGVYDLFANIIPMLETVGKGIGYGAGQLQENPTRALQNLGGAFGEYGSQLANLPEAFAKYSESRGLIKNKEDKDLYDQLINFVPRKPDPITPDENRLQRMWRSIHLPKPGEFDYAEALGMKPAQFKEEAEADQLAKQLLPSFLAVSGGAPAIALQQFGAEENPFGVLATPPLASKALKTLKNGVQMPDWISREKTGNAIGDAAKTLKNELSQGYESYKSDIRNAGIKGDTKQTVTKNIESNIIDPTTGKPITQSVTVTETPSIAEISNQLKGVDVKTIESVHKAFESGDIGDLISAESDLGIFKSNQWNDYFNRTNPLDRDALHYATKMENKINKIIEEMASKLEPGKSNKLIELRSQWKTDLRPFLDIEPINRFVKGEITGADLTRRLQGNTKQAELFRATMADKFKNVSRNKLKNELLKFGIGASKLSALLALLGK